MLLLLCGCAPEANFEFDLKRATSDCSNPGLPQGLFVRVTFLRREKADAAMLLPSHLRKYRAVCEHTFVPTGKQTAVDIYVPRDATEADPNRYTIRIDAFDHAIDAGKLQYSAQVEGVDLGQHKPVPFVLRPTRQVGAADATRNGFSCAPPAQRYRSFHSATLLPNGQVLIFGGLAADHTDTNTPKLKNSDEVAYATSKAEIYDPSTSSFYEAPVSSSRGHTVRPRAFHQAFLLPSPSNGPYLVLLVGGVGPKPGCQDAGGCAAFRVGFSRLDLPFLITPHEQAVAVEMGLLTYTPPPPGGTNWAADYMRIDQDAQQKPLPAQLLPAGAGEDLIAVGGGTTKYAPPGGFEGDLPWLLLSEATKRAADDLTVGRHRAGHAVARVGATAYLVVGGTMTGAIGDDGDVAEIVSLGSPAASPVKATEIGSLVSTAWHTLTSIVSDANLATPATPPTGALWAGGYKLRDNKTSYMRATDVQTNQMTQLDLSGGIVTPRPVAPGSWIPVAYHEATRLYDGSVLLTGGNADKPFCQNNIICPQEQMAIYKGTDLSILQPLRLAVPRFGHRVTRLLDSTLLVTGGITAQFKCKNPDAKNPDVPVLSVSGLVCQRGNYTCDGTNKCDTGYACGNGKCACTDIGICGVGSTEAQLTKDAEIFNPRDGSDSERPVFAGDPPPKVPTPCATVQPK